MAVSTAKYVEKTITAQNSFSDVVLPMKKKDSDGYLNVTVFGTFSATVTLQRSFDKGVTWLDVDTYTTSAEDFKEDMEVGVWYRIGVKTGEFISGSVYTRLGIGN